MKLPDADAEVLLTFFEASALRNRDQAVGLGPERFCKCGLAADTKRMFTDGKSPSVST
jgi:hypothetical protein